MKKIKFNSEKFLKIFTIAIYTIALLIYEIGICNGDIIKNFIQNNQMGYNFSLSRIVLYVIFYIVLFKYIDKLIPIAKKGLDNKYRKAILVAYSVLLVIVSIYVLIRWISVIKAWNLIIALLMGLVFVIYVSSDYIKNVIVLTFTFGVLFTFTTDFNHAIDEKKHMMSAINIAGGNINYAKNPKYDAAYHNIIFNCDIDSFLQFYGKKYNLELRDDWNITDETYIYYVCSSPAEYNPILYTPSVIGILFTRILGGSIADVYVTARLFNLFAYALMLIAILKLLPYKQKIFFIIYTIPFQILLAASLSVDGICIGILGLFIAYCLKLSEVDYKAIKLKQILTIMIMFAFCLLAKNLAYIAIILFIFVLPIFKILKNNKKNLPILCTIIIIATVVCGVLLLNKFNSTTQSGGDPRGGDTSVTRQIEFLLSSPINIINVGFSHVANSLLNFNWYTYMSHGAFFGKYSNQIWLMEMVFIIYVCVTDNSKKIKLRTVIVSLITFAAVFGSTSLMLYLAFTPVGQINISGYQPRYIIPIIPVILMLINSSRYLNKSTKEQEEKNNINITLTVGAFMVLHLFCLVYVI